MSFYIQLYSVHEEAKKDFMATLEQVAKIGFDGVEFAGYFDHSKEELSAKLKELGMTCVASHIGAQGFEEELDMHISYLKEFGAKYAVLPYYKMDTEEDALAAAKLFQGYALKCKEQGIVFAYHNHGFEFNKTEDGKYLMDIVLENAPDVMMEPDLYWIQYAGADPAEFIKKWQDRIVLLHIKDIENMETKRCVDAGTGMLDFAALRDLAVNSEYAIYEQEEYDISCWESAKNSYENMKSIF